MAKTHTDKEYKVLKNKYENAVNNESATKRSLDECRNDLEKVKTQIESANRTSREYQSRCSKLADEVQALQIDSHNDVAGAFEVRSKKDRKINGKLRPKGSVIGYITPVVGYEAINVTDSVACGTASVKACQEHDGSVNRADAESNAQELAQAKQTVDAANAHCADLENAIEDLKAEIASLKEAAGKGDPEEQDARENSDNEIED